MNDYPKIVLTSDPRVQAVPLCENNDPMVNVASADIPELSIDTRMGHLAGPERFWLRSGVVKRIIEAVHIMPQGYRLGLVEGYRSKQVQTKVYMDYLETLRTEHPDWDEEHTREIATRFASRPDMVAPHSTGGAADIVLLNTAGQQVDVGADVNDTPELSSGRCYTSAELEEPAATNRAMLSQALSAVGMVNYPSEWWHWSYGDQYWGWTTGAGRTLYSPTAVTTGS